MPPAVTLLNYISSGILWRIFSQTGICAGFSLYIYYSPEGTAKLRWAGGRAAPRLPWQLTQKDGCAQRTGAHARPEPTSIIYLPRVLCLSVCECVCVCACVCVTICVGTLCYSFSFNNQTDSGYETEGLEREG